MSKEKEKELHETPGTEPEPDAPETAGNAELDELKQQNAELNDKLLRQYAEFDNYKKRTAKEKEEITTFAKALCIKEILEVVDNFERALATPVEENIDPAEAEFRKGVDMIFHQLCDKLKALGVTEIDALGKPFDPTLHNAVSQIENADFGENTVCQVLQRGYQLNDRVVRHAVVVVANP